MKTKHKNKEKMAGKEWMFILNVVASTCKDTCELVHPMHSVLQMLVHMSLTFPKFYHATRKLGDGDQQAANKATVSNVNAQESDSRKTSHQGQARQGIFSFYFSPMML